MPTSKCQQVQVASCVTLKSVTARTINTACWLCRVSVDLLLCKSNNITRRRVVMETGRRWLDIRHSLPLLLSVLQLFRRYCAMIRHASRLSVCPSVTLRYLGHAGWNTSKIISCLIRLGCLLPADLPNIKGIISRI